MYLLEYVPSGEIPCRPSGEKIQGLRIFGWVEKGKNLIVQSPDHPESFTYKDVKYKLKSKKERVWKTLIAKFHPTYVSWDQNDNQHDWFPDDKIGHIVEKRVKNDDLDMSDSFKYWFTGDLESKGLDVKKMKSSYKYRDGIITYTLTTSEDQGFTLDCVEQAYRMNSSHPMSLGPDTWMEGNIKIYPRYKYDTEKGYNIEFDPSLFTTNIEEEMKISLNED